MTPDDEARAFEEELGQDPREERPPLLRALEAILADPEELRLDVQKLRVRLKKQHRGRELDRAVARAVVARAARRTMISGGATSLATVLPGPGTLAGAVADAALALKFQVEMVQSIGWAYGRDLTRREERDASLVIAGVGALAEVGKTAGTRMSTSAYLRAVDRLLAGGTGRAIAMLFRVLGIRLAPRTLLRVVPFGVGVAFSVLMNRALSKAVGERAIAYFER